MKVVFICLYDAGGQNQLLKEAIGKYTEHEARSVVCEQFYLDYDLDIFYPLADMSEFVKVLGEADFYCFLEGIVDFNEFNVSSRLTHTNHLIRWVGSMARQNLDHILLEELRGDIPLQLTTFDWTVASNIGYSIYVPLSVDLENLPKPNRNPEKIRVFHAPTQRAYKNTDYFLQIMDKIAKEFPYVETVLVEQKSWKETMKIRASCDISFDQLGFAGGWGHSSLESMALGMPVLCGLNYYVKAMHPDCPVVAVTKQTLKDRIVKLIQDDELRKMIGEKGVEYVRRVHDVKRTVHQWVWLIEYVRSGKDPAMLVDFPLEVEI